MPSNDDTKQQNEKSVAGRAYGDAAVGSVSSNDHAKAVDHTSTDEITKAPMSSDHSMPQEFTFFKKETRKSSRFSLICGLCEHLAVNRLCCAI